MVYSIVLQHIQTRVQTSTNSHGHMICKYMERKGWAAMLTVTWGKSENRAAKRACKQGIHKGVPKKGLVSSKVILQNAI